MTESTRVSLLDIDLGAAAAAFGAGGGKPVEKRSGNGTLENVDLQAAVAGMDFPGAMALINGLTFEAMHPELVPVPAETAAPVPDDETNLPDWLQPAADAELPAKAEEPAHGLTAEEAAARFDERFDEDAEAGSTTQAIGATGEGRIPPAGVEKKRWDDVKQGLSSYLETHWKEMAERGVGIAVGAVLGKLVEDSPWVQAGLGMALIATSVRSRIMDNSGRIGRFIELRKKIHPEFYRSKNVIRRGISLVAEAEMRSLQGAFWLTERPITEGIGWGLVLQGVMDGLTPDRPAQPQIPGAAGGGLGEGPVGPTINAPVHGSNVDSAGYYHGVSDANLLQPPADVASTNEAIQQAVQAAAQQAEAAAEQAAAASAQAAEVARQAAEAAQVPAQTMAKDLAGGTIWGHEAEFVRGLGIGHENVATNALKNLDYGLKAAGQIFSRLNPEEVVKLVNRDVAAKIAEAASNLIGRDPSILSPIDKLLWDIGVAGRQATPAEAAEIIKSFATGG